MEALDRINRPSKAEQKVAMESYDSLAAVIEKQNLYLTLIENG